MYTDIVQQAEQNVRYVHSAISEDSFRNINFSEGYKWKEYALNHLAFIACRKKVLIINYFYFIDH